MAVENPQWEEDVQANVYSITDETEVWDYQSKESEETGMYGIVWPVRVSPSRLLSAFGEFLKEAEVELPQGSSTTEGAYSGPSYEIRLEADEIISLIDLASGDFALEMNIETRFGNLTYENDGVGTRTATFATSRELVDPILKFVTSTSSDKNLDPEKLREVIGFVGREKERDPVNRVLRISEGRIIPLEGSN